MGLFQGMLLLFERDETIADLLSRLQIPETKGRTYEELDIMFSKGLATKEFKTYVVDGVHP